MPLIHRLLQRWGFVKLGRYGLVRTADGRILTTRPKILDDGRGGRIVGWEDSDPGATELAAWQPARPATAPVVPAVSVAQPDASAAVMSAAVADADPVDEDDWEWTIALAKARATAEAAETIAVIPGAFVAPEAPKAAAPSPPAPAPATPPPTRSASPPAPSSVGARPVPSTVIPVPALPVVDTSLHAGRMAPVVRSSPTRPLPVAPMQFAKGTGTVTTSAETAAPVAKPAVSLPPAARAVELPSRDRRRR